MTRAFCEKFRVPRVEHVLARDALSAGQHVENELAQRIDIRGRCDIDRAALVKLGGYKEARTNDLAIGRVALGRLVER